MRPFIRAVVCSVGLFQAMPVAAQSEQQLRQAFEGHFVIVRMDMPATEKGVDLHPGHEPAVDLPSYSVRIRQFGIALHDGDRVMVTAVRVKKKNIEFQLAGGGYGVWGDDTGSVYVPTAYKSDREKNLEKAVKSESDPDRRRSMQRELNDLRNDRDRENRRADAQKRDLEAQKQTEIAQKRLGAGSRFNLWFDDDRLERAVPNPSELVALLSQVIAFEGDDVLPASASVPPPLPPEVAPAGSVSDLRRGLSVDEVHGLLGKPTREKSGKQGDLKTLTEWYEEAYRVTEIFYVDGVIVRFSTSSK